MKTLILKTATVYLLPLLLLFSLFILLRGHYLPGGGFIGGLIAAIAFILHLYANGIKNTRKLLRFHPGVLIPIGMLISFLSALLPVFSGKPFLTTLWFSKIIPVIGLVGSALFFDIGVYLVVIGISLTILFTISESVS